MHGQSKITPKSWLAFDLNVLRRFTFKSVALPIADHPALGVYLKRWNARVSANHPMQSSWMRIQSQIENSAETLTAEDINVVLEDAYVPGYKLQNPSLSNWFNETDSWWFDNVRRNIGRLRTPMASSIAASLALATGDYVASFNEETRQLRSPLSNVFRKLWSIRPEPFDNGLENLCHNQNPNDFIAETQAELMFLRLPAPHAQTARSNLGRAAWREEWLRGGNEFWGSLESNLHGKLGSATETKSQYLHLLEETLRRASHIKTWAIAHVESGFVQTSDIAETIGRIRTVETVYTKDFTELTGAKAVIITA